MHCVKCGTEVPVGGSFCPKCGTALENAAEPINDRAQPQQSPAKPSKRMGCLKLILIGFGVFVLLGFIGSLLPKPPPSASGTKSTSATETSSPDGKEGSNDDEEPLPIAVTARELFGAYASNEASAQGYFGEQKLLVTAVVDKVALDFLNNPEVLLKTQNQFMSAHAALASDAREVAGDFSPGDTIKLICDGVSEVASIPMLKDCRPAPKGQKGRPIEWRK